MEPWMIILLIIGGVAVVITIVMLILKQKNNKALISRVKEIGNFENGILTINNIQFYVQFIKVGEKDEFTINSSLIAQKKSYGKSELIRLASTKLPKLIIVYPYNGRIKRYINENEMEFITCRNFFWNMHVCKLSELGSFKSHIEERTQ
ncbi:hypothetical protein LJC17_01390 [Acholeplasma sp. OttesenSCG-928-E16]|nr:hypothetical protein [Acholeplasma sp. OttesenSCG-928-E16]